MDEQATKRRAAADDTGRDAGADSTAVLEYIGDMCRELGDMARRSGQPRLASMLDAARHEADKRHVTH